MGEIIERMGRCYRHYRVGGLVCYGKQAHHKIKQDNHGIIDGLKTSDDPSRQVGT